MAVNPKHDPKHVREAIERGLLTQAEYEESLGLSVPEPEPVPKWTGSRSRDQKPAVTPAEYKAGRAVLDALPPGYYVKCANCHGWWTDGNFTLSHDGPVCERCR